MENIFYINKDEKRDWYMLCVKETHYCIAASDNLIVLLKTIEDYIKTYKSAGRVYDMLETLSDHGKVAPKVFEVRKQYYEEHGREYSRLIENRIAEVESFIEIERVKRQPKFKSKKGIKRLIRKVVV